MPISATRPKLSVAWLSRCGAARPVSSLTGPVMRAPAMPTCMRKLPWWSNFTTCESGPPLPPIQTLFMPSMAIPWFDTGQV